MLYNFEKLDLKLDELGFPKLKSGSGFQLIKGIDFEEAYKAGSITFEDNGIYLEYQDRKYRGYMFIQEAYITYNGGPVKMPRFHTRKCTTIQSFLESGRFNQRYEWSNSNVNNLIDKQSRTKYENEVLNLCANCRRESFDEINDTEEFHDRLDKSELEEESIEIDIFGYVRGKEKISKAYRTKMNFTCESCGIQAKSISDRRYWHTHHKDGDKTHNEDVNLECLCVCCHSRKDQRHEQNFAKKNWNLEIKHFVKKYRDDLMKLNSPCITEFE